jgi:hypothetical protein
MNTYLTQSKVRLIRQAQQDLLAIHGLHHTPFTRKIYFYFFELNGCKYVHKESLKFVYSNADTYTTEVDPHFCHLTQETVPVDVCSFLESYTGDFLPKLLESNQKFLVYEYIDGDPVDFITQQEFYRLKSRHNEMELTPFYNSMTYNLARTENDIKLIDLKHFETKKLLPFFIYLYNEDNSVNSLYIEKNTDVSDIKKHLSVDYPMDSTTIIEY